jgi:GrpB-like predicted nucleotidyltransferase (UPF0157 family)
MLGLSRGTVRVVPYQREWAALFAREAALLRTLLGASALAFEHIGSTAIEGMDAKPIIDLMVAVESLNAAEVWIPELEAVGYEFRPDTGVPDRLFFAKGPRRLRTHHLSLAEPTSEFYVQKLLFRDFLRRHADAREEYRALKGRLSRAHPEDRAAYTEGKRAFVERVLSLAAAEAQGGYPA